MVKVVMRHNDLSERPSSSARARAALDGASNMVTWSSNSYKVLEWLPELWSHQIPFATCTGFTLNTGADGGDACLAWAGAANSPESASTVFLDTRISAVV